MEVKHTHKVKKIIETHENVLDKIQSICTMRCTRLYKNSKRLSEDSSGLLRNRIVRFLFLQRHRIMSKQVDRSAKKDVWKCKLNEEKGAITSAAARVVKAQVTCLMSKKWASAGWGGKGEHGEPATAHYPERKITSPESPTYLQHKSSVSTDGQLAHFLLLAVSGESWDQQTSMHTSQVSTSAPSSLKMSSNHV